MRTYIVKYWYENIREDCADYNEVDIVANDIENALLLFKERHRVYKRIESIIEKIS